MTGSELRTIRKGLGLNQEDFATLLGVQKAAVSKWELGRRKIPKLVEMTLDQVAKKPRKKP